jgi:hypothetical protein
LAGIFVCGDEEVRFRFQLEISGKREEKSAALRARYLKHFNTKMAVHIFPSSYRCDCGHESHFSERTVREMRLMSQRRRQLLTDSEIDKHSIEFEGGQAVAVICPRLGRLIINATE